ncbi:nuclear nucleic acid-binding protein C1D [Brienomyrus brachyistius]|uniref:nuclear nucleic acid-binding protein C1D n=1 Tax=Brienomyrus brachyistius TaxID=42636 RepID=UPI0020B32528|nr:nuclear nucleic acid-binding protein C1D [Brienomyrus brachyistius]
MADEDVPVEEYPAEIEEYLTEFDSSVDSMHNMVKTLVSVSKNELVQKLDPLEQAKLDLMSAYALNSLYWTYLVTQGVNPKEHGVKQELERIRTYMNKVREMADRKTAARLDKAAASRFMRSALWEPGQEKAGSTPGSSQARECKKPSRK